MTAYQRLPPASFRSALDPDIDTLDGGFARPVEQRTRVSYDLAWVDGKGHATWDSRRLPDTIEIEAAVSCLARGAMLRGKRGPVAIEDLLPGDEIMTVDGNSVPIAWIGSRTYQPGGNRPLFYRVSANAFGGQGPKNDVLLGGHAQIMIDSPKCRALVGSQRAFAPISAFEDGMTVTAVQPPGEVSVYGLACAGQEAVTVSGLSVETYHPSRTTTHSLTRVVLADMARLFPQAAAGAGFGAPRIPYLSLSEAQGLSLNGF